MKRLIIQNDNHQYKFLNIKDKYNQACFQLYKDYIISNEEGLFQINDFSSNITESKELPTSDKSYWNGIKINSNIVAFTSNEILSNGKNEILFFNHNSKKNY